jgi:hypothetical protein
MRVRNFFGNSELAGVDTFVRKGRVKVPEWTASDEKVRRVVAFRLRAVLRITNDPNSPADLATCRELDRRVMEMYSKSRRTPYVKHFATLKEFGGPLAYYTSLIYRRYRLLMTFDDLAEKYGKRWDVFPTVFARLNQVAAFLFNEVKPARKQGLVPVARILALHEEGSSVRAIAASIGWSRDCVEDVLRANGRDWYHGPSPLDARRVLELRRRGLSHKAIAKEIGSSASAVCRAIQKQQEEILC